VLGKEFILGFNLLWIISYSQKIDWEFRSDWCKDEYKLPLRTRQYV